MIKNSNFKKICSVFILSIMFISSFANPIFAAQAKDIDLDTRVMLLNTWSTEQYQVYLKFEKKLNEKDYYVDSEIYSIDYRDFYDYMWQKRVDIGKASTDVMKILNKSKNLKEQLNYTIKWTKNFFTYSIHKEDVLTSINQILSLGTSISTLSKTFGLDAESWVSVYEFAKYWVSETIECNKVHSQAVKQLKEVNAKIKQFSDYEKELDDALETWQEYYDKFMSFPSPTYKE